MTTSERQRRTRKPVKPLPIDQQAIVNVLANPENPKRGWTDPVDWSLSDLRGANAEGKWFANANLRRADLSGAHMAGADLTNANLSRTMLHGTELWAANLTGANLLGADISGAIFSDRLEGPAIGLTQAQIDSAMADPDDPPILDGVLDAETGEPLVWRGGVGLE